MSVPDLKKGWCPSLTKPMESGDGWLVRLNLPQSQIHASTACEIAKLAQQYGNGELDITSRGNLQIRGVSGSQCEALRDAVYTLGFTDIPRPPRKSTSETHTPLGYQDNRLALGVLFGRVNAHTLLWLSETCPAATFTLGSERTLTLDPITSDAANSILEQAESKGLLTQSDDVRRAIEACPGAPACKSANGETRLLALAIANAMPNLTKDGKTIHVSGCAKGCACGKAASRVITASAGAYIMAVDAKADDTPLLTGLSPQSVIQILTQWDNT